MPELGLIKAEAIRLLAEGVVEVVVAFRPGDTHCIPTCVFTNVDEVENLV